MSDTPSGPVAPGVSSADPPSLSTVSAGHRPLVIFGQLPTGAKIFLIISAALLPLAVIASFATLKTSQTASQEARARLRVAAGESARNLAIELIGDMTALRVALNALEVDAADAPSCARAQGVFAQQATSGTRFVIVDRRLRVLCGTDFPADLMLPPAPGDMPIAARIVPDRGLVLTIKGATGQTTASALFPTRFLAETGRPTGYLVDYQAFLQREGTQLSLTDAAVPGVLERRERSRQMLGVGELVLDMSVPSAPITSPVLIAMFLPILMWAAAASIAWFVVDRLLIRPLRELRRSVAAYIPGKEIDPGQLSALPAQEIRELGDTFRLISRTVAMHESGLAEGLVRQTKLTREVHHRVKNNLQVISSLINFHARGARSADATAAYASIQRRVDALAVVHRNHFAEMEESRGLSLRSVIGELASNIRATAPDDNVGAGLTLDVTPFLVTQDIAIAVAFLITEIVELAMTCQPMAHIRISLSPGETADKAVLRISSPALIESDMLREVVAERYGRVMEGLSRQLRSRLHSDPLVGSYDIAISVLARD